jgi:uncharacterized protein DUF3822
LKTAKKDYKLFKKIKEDKFEVDQLHNYELNLLLGNRDFQVAVIDKRERRCLMIEDYIISSIDSYSKLIKVFEHIFDDHHLLKAGFWANIKVGIKGNKFALVPESLFSPDSLFDYLKFNCKVNKEHDTLKYFKHDKSGAVNTLAIDTRLYNWLETLYPEKEITYFHQSSALIEGVLEQLPNYPDDSIFVYVDRFKLHIITTKNKKLEYYNQFYIKQFSDYIKYIMTVMKGLNRDQLKTNVILWGYLGKQSKHYNEFAKYIKNLSFGKRTKLLKFGYPFDELQEHHYFDLYNVHLCE